jgi:Icc protein
LKKHEQQPLRVVQISDTHLFASTEGRLLGLNTEDSLRLVLEKVQREQPLIDVILATGDIAQDASEVAYMRFQQHLSQFNAPNYWLQGNHDITQPILNTLSHQSHLSPCVIERGAWHIIMLNSSVEHEVPGQFAPSELAFLQQALAKSKKSHVMVCLHHHPIPMDCAWLDNQVVRNAEDFWQVIDQFSHVKAIVWGHVHQESDRIRNGVRLLSVPSTCVQFKPLSEDFAIDDLSPGYRWFDLYANGDIVTQVSRVEGVKFVVDWTVRGY